MNKNPWGGEEGPIFVFSPPPPFFIFLGGGGAGAYFFLKFWFFYHQPTTIPTNAFKHYETNSKSRLAFLAAHVLPLQSLIVINNVTCLKRAITV